MGVLFYYLKRNWRAVDEWLFDHFDFGLLEMADVAETFLIEATR
jgi:hypothetical protein